MLSFSIVCREIEIDENTDRVLTELASAYNGDLIRTVLPGVLNQPNLILNSDKKHLRPAYTA